MSTTIDDLILSTRAFVGDGPADNLARMEKLNNPDMGLGIDGTNRVFPLQNYPVVQVITVVVDGSMTSNYTYDEATGILTIAGAPPTQSAFATYYYELMTDDAWTEFVTAGLQRLDSSTGDPTVDVPNVPEGLLAALKTYAAAAWAQRISSQTGLWYNQRLQERIEDRDSISKKYSMLAQAYWKDGDNQVANYYKGAGQQYRPAMAIVQHTPRQYTPYR